MPCSGCMLWSCCSPSCCSPRWHLTDALPSCPNQPLCRNDQNQLGAGEDAGGADSAIPLPVFNIGVKFTHITAGALPGLPTLTRCCPCPRPATEGDLPKLPQFAKSPSVSMPWEDACPSVRLPCLPPALRVGLVLAACCLPLHAGWPRFARVWCRARRVSLKCTCACTQPLTHPPSQPALILPHSLAAPSARLTWQDGGTPARLETTQAKRTPRSAGAGEAHTSWGMEEMRTLPRPLLLLGGMRSTR